MLFTDKASAGADITIIRPDSRHDVGEYWQCLEEPQSKYGGHFFVSKIDRNLRLVCTFAFGIDDLNNGDRRIKECVRLMVRFLFPQFSTSVRDDESFRCTSIVHLRFFSLFHFPLFI